MVNLINTAGLISTTILLVMLYDSYSIKKQLYPTLAHFSKSKMGVAMLHIEWFLILHALSGLGVMLFIGTIRPFEDERIREKLWYAVTDTCIAFAVFSNDFASSFFMSLSSLLFVKYFHFSFEVRVDSIEREPFIPNKTLFRSIIFFLVFLYIDVMYASYMSSQSHANNNLQFLLINEYLILCISVIYSTAKFIVHYFDYKRNFSLQEKGTFLSYLFILKTLVETTLYLIFLSLTIIHHGIIPLLFIRPFLSTAVSFFQSIKAQINCKKVVAYINHSCPNATAEELQQAHDRTCVVCREEMISAKKLPCGHMFHFHCLKSWFQRQQTCPTCRLNMLNIMKDHNTSSNQPTPHTRPPPPSLPPHHDDVRTGPSGQHSQPLSASSSHRSQGPHHAASGFTKLYGQVSPHCSCSTCQLIRIASLNNGGAGQQLPPDPDLMLKVPTAAEIRNLSTGAAQAQLIRNITLNLQAVTAQLTLLSDIINAPSSSS